jgi:hypothetical protein
VEEFVQRVEARNAAGENGFESAAATDRVIAMMLRDADKGASTRPAAPAELARRDHPAARFHPRRLAPRLRDIHGQLMARRRSS